METEHLAGLFFQKVAIHRPRTHHDDLLLQLLAFPGRDRIALFRRVDLAVERDEAQITALPGDQVIAEIKGQTDPDHGDQVLTEHVTLFDESLHNA